MIKGVGRETDLIFFKEMDFGNRGRIYVLSYLLLVLVGFSFSLIPADDADDADDAKEEGDWNLIGRF
jgi:hypothetical protein